MFVRRARGYALNFGNPRAVVYIGYLTGALLLFVVSYSVLSRNPG